MIWFQALFASMDQYLQGLFVLAHDSAAEVRKLVSSLFTFVAPSNIGYYYFVWSGRVGPFCLMIP